MLRCPCAPHANTHNLAVGQFNIHKDAAVLSLRRRFWDRLEIADSNLSRFERQHLIVDLCYSVSLHWVSNRCLELWVWQAGNLFRRVFWHTWRPALTVHDDALNSLRYHQQPTTAFTISQRWAPPRKRTLKLMMFLAQSQMISHP